MRFLCIFLLNYLAYCKLFAIFAAEFKISWVLLFLINNNKICIMKLTKKNLLKHYALDIEFIHRFDDVLDSVKPDFSSIQWYVKFIDTALTRRRWSHEYLLLFMKSCELVSSIRSAWFGLPYVSNASIWC